MVRTVVVLPAYVVAVLYTFVRRIGTDDFAISKSSMAGRLAVRPDLAEWLRELELKQPVRSCARVNEYRTLESLLR